MIGNKIEFIYYDWNNYSSDNKGEEHIGIVVDAFTKVTGTIRGSNDVFLGIGGGSTTGNTDSKRMYKVEFNEKWDTEKQCTKYKDICDWQLRRIISYAGSNNQEVNEEKIETQTKTTE